MGGDKIEVVTEAEPTPGRDPSSGVVTWPRVFLPTARRPSATLAPCPSSSLAALQVEPGRDGRLAGSGPLSHLGRRGLRPPHSPVHAQQAGKPQAGASSRAASLINTAAFPVHLLQVPSLIITVWQERQRKWLAGSGGKSPV